LTEPAGRQQPLINYFFLAGGIWYMTGLMKKKLKEFIKDPVGKRKLFAY